MTKYSVEMRKYYNEDFDSYIGNYIEAETEEEALEIAKQWLIDNGYDGDVESIEYNVSEF